MKCPGPSVAVLLLAAAHSAIAQDAAKSSQRHLDAGIAASIQGRRAEAIAEFEAALAIDPQLVPAMHDLAFEFALEGHADKSLDWLRRAAEWGCDDVALLLVTDGLGAIRGDARFASILERVRANERAKWPALEKTRLNRAETHRREMERVREVAGLSPVQWRDGPTLSIHRVAFSPSGDLLLTWGEDGIVRAWNPWTGEPLFEFGRFARANVAVSFSRDGERVLVFDSLCGQATLYDGLSGEELARIGDDSSVFDRAALAADGSLVATLDHRGRVQVWESAGGQASPGFSRDATLLASEIEFDPDGARLLVACRDLTARVLDARTGSTLATIGTGDYPVSQAHFTVDGRRIVTDTAGVKIGVWSPADSKGRPLVWIDDHARASPIASRLSPDGTRIVTPAVTRGEPGEDLVLWDVDSGKAVGRLTETDPLSTTMAFSPDGTSFVSARRKTGWRLFDGRTGKVVASSPTEYASEPIFSPDSRTLAVRTARYLAQLETYDARTGKPIRTAARFWGSIIAMAFSPDSERIAIATKLAECQIASARIEAAPTIVSGQIRASFSFCMNPKGDLALSTHIAGAEEMRASTARLWSLETGLSVRDFGDFDGETLSGDFTPDGRRLLLAGDSRSGAEWIRIVDVESGATVADLPGNHDCLHARFDATGTRIVSTCLDGKSQPEPGHARLWDVTTGSLIAALPIGLAGDVLFTAPAVLRPDGALLASAGADPKGSVNLWDGRTGAPIRTLLGHERAIRHITFSPSGAGLVSTSWDGTAKVWDVATGRLEADLRHESAVWHASFDPSGERLATASLSGVVRVVDLSGKTEPMTLSHAREVRVVRFSPDGSKLATGCHAGELYIFDASDDWSRKKLDGHDATIEDVEFTPDGRRLVTIAGDGTTRVWDVATGRLLLTRVLYADGNWLAYEPSGHYAGSPSAADWARIVVKDRAYPLSSYANVLESRAKIAASLAGSDVPAPSSLPSAPQLELVSPASGEIADGAFRLEAIGLDDYGIEAVTVLQDGHPVDSKAVEAALLESRGGRTVRLSLPLSIPSGRSATTVVVRAENRRRILSRPVSVHLRHAPPRRELYVLALGVGDYDADAMDLSCPTKDVADLTSLFVRQDGAMYDKVHVRALTDREVSLKAVRRIRDDFLLHARPEDTIVVFAAGHGIRSATNEYFFLTSDSTADDPYGGIARKDLEDLVSWEKLHARKRVLLLDTCHSGTSARTRGASPLFGPDDQARLDESVREGIYVIAASADDEFAREQEGNGLFTRALLDGLAGSADADKNGYVEIEELKAYAGRQVHERSGGRQVPTFPKVEAGENFKLVKVAPAR